MKMDKRDENWIPAICGICPYNCEVLVRKYNAEIVEVKADIQAPEGCLCPRGKHAPEIIYHENRIRYPMIRVGEKGTKSFRRASWEEALTVAAEGFKRCRNLYGARSLASYSGASSLEDSLCDVGDSFFEHMGSPNDMSSGSICFVPSRIMGPQLALGLFGYELSPDINESKVIFIWGSNPASGSGKGNYREVVLAKKRGAKIVLIDPRQNRIADFADCWIKIEPGTDGALLLALAKRMVEEGDYDIKFAEQYVTGLEKWKDDLKKYSYRELFEECGITKILFEKLYSLFNMTCAASFLCYTGLEYQPSATQSIRLMYLLWALGGKLDVPGGMLIRGSQKETFQEYEQKDEMPVGADKYPVFYAFTGKGQFVEFPRAVLEEQPYPVRGLLVYGASPILSYPNYAIWKKAYEKLDMMVVIERSWSEECLWADVILPATTYYENLSYCYYKNRTRLRKPVISPVGESKNDVIILHKLAEKLGFGDCFPKTEEEILERAFSNDKSYIQTLWEMEYGVEEKEAEHVYKKYEKGLLRKDGRPGFPTDSGKIEIYSKMLRCYGYSAEPQYVSPKEGNNYPYILMTGARNKYHYNSYGLSYKGLQGFYNCPRAEIGKGLAEELSIKDGDQVVVENENGKLILQAHIIEMADYTVHIEVGGGSEFHLSPWKETNANRLCNLYQRDEISGFIACKSVGCNIYKVKERK